MTGKKIGRPRTIIAVGTRFARLVVTGEGKAIFDGRCTRFRYECLCDCGGTLSTDPSALISGRTRSCGCLHSETGLRAIRVARSVLERPEVLERARRITREKNTKHDRSKTPEFVAWVQLRVRCRDLKDKNYAARGIRACEGWDSFETFFADMGERPSADHSIDRKDNNGHYSCGKCAECKQNGWAFNCRWATSKQQNRNTRRTIFIDHNGERLSLADWSDRLGLSQACLRHRIRVGWDPEKALSKPSIRASSRNQ